MQSEMITLLNIRRQVDHIEGAAHPKLTSLLAACNEYELYDRRNFTGHLTVSGIVVHLRTREALLLNHKTLEQWIVPGGHINWEEKSIQAAVLHKITEKCGLNSDKLIPMNLDKGVQYCVAINSHTILSNSNNYEPMHWHHDFYFVFAYTGDKQIDINQYESTEYQWLSVDNLLISNLLNSELVDRIILDGVLQHHKEQMRINNDNSSYFVTPIAWYQFRLAQSYHERGESDLSEQMWLQSIDSFERTYDEQYETPPDILSAIWNLSLIYERTSRPELALKTLDKGIELSEMYARWDERYTHWVTDLNALYNDIRSQLKIEIKKAHTSS